MLLFGVALVTRRNDDSCTLGRLYFFGALTFCVAAVGYDVTTACREPRLDGLAHPAAAGSHRVWRPWLLAVENLWAQYGAASTLARLAVVVSPSVASSPMKCFFFSDAFITRGRVDPGLGLGRAIAAAFMTPLLALAMARNREWRVDIHVSRQMVLHTATLLASGCFLLAVAAVRDGAASGRRRVGPRPAACDVVRQYLVLATVLSSGNLRRRAKFLISRNLL